ncbi:MAG: HD-GYP domain-containing protein [Betaproteobacteria bacterium]|nr:HD-GYP domain-containing protein [Betaproteobacteria bacterium]
MTAQDAGPGPVCAACGAPLVGVPHARRAAGDLCEPCFLGRAAQAPAWAAAEAAYVALAEALAAALDAREHETGLHSKRVACHTLVLARRFSDDSQLLSQVYWGALLHDLGKIGIADAILLKQGALTDAEWRIMRTHPVIGHRILSAAPFMALAAEIALCHEERFDGSGYPRGLRGEAIPMWARLFAVIDTLDAMTSDRPYRKGMSFDTAQAEIRRMAGSQFDPVAVAAFMAEEPTLREMVALKCGDAPPIPLSA